MEPLWYVIVVRLFSCSSFYYFCKYRAYSYLQLQTQLGQMHHWKCVWHFCPRYVGTYLFTQNYTILSCSSFHCFKYYTAYSYLQLQTQVGRMQQWKCIWQFGCKVCTYISIYTEFYNSLYNNTAGGAVSRGQLLHNQEGLLSMPKQR